MYSLTIRNRAAGVVFAVAVLALGAVFLTVGFALLLALVVAGGVLGTGIAVYRRLRGGRGAPSMTINEIHSGSWRPDSQLDPMLEIKPAKPAAIRPRNEND